MRITCVAHEIGLLWPGETKMSANWLNKCVRWIRRRLNTIRQTNQLVASSRLWLKPKMMCPGKLLSGRSALLVLWEQDNVWYRFHSLRSRWILVDANAEPSRWQIGPSADWRISKKEGRRGQRWGGRGNICMACAAIAIYHADGLRMSIFLTRLWRSGET